MSFFALKIIALLSMLWDHVTHVWPLALTVEVLFFPDAADTIPALLVPVSYTHLTLPTTSRV